MPEVLHVGASVQCTHAGPGVRPAGNSRVRVSGQQVWTRSCDLTVSGCPFTIGPPVKPQPCVTITWLIVATRVNAGGDAVVLRSSTPLCRSGEGIPQGSGRVVSSQTRVKAL